MRKFWNNAKKSIKLLYQKGALHVIGGNFATKFVTFFGSIVVVRLLTKDEYGILGYADNLYSMAYVVAGLGMTNSILRYVVLGKDNDEKYSLLTYMRRRAFICNIILMAVFCVLWWFYPHSEKFAAAKYLMLLEMLDLPFQYMFDNNLITERALFHNKTFAYISFGTMVAVVAARCFGAYSDGVVGVILMVDVVYIIMSLVMNRKISRWFRGAVVTKIEKAKKKELDAYGIQYMITNGLWSLFMLVDIFMMGKMVGDPIAVADYKVAYVWPGNIGIIASAIGIFITPYFVRHEDDKVWVRTYYKKLILANIVIVGLMGLLMCVFARPLILLYAGRQYLNTINLMRILLVATFINNALRATTANVLAAMGKIKFNMAVSICGMLSQIVLDYMLIPKYGGMGVAFTGILNFTIMATALFIFFSREYNLFGKDDKQTD